MLGKQQIVDPNYHSTYMASLELDLVASCFNLECFDKQDWYR